MENGVGQVHEEDAIETQVYIPFQSFMFLFYFLGVFLSKLQIDRWKLQIC
jgi:hypothetical protein